MEFGVKAAPVPCLYADLERTERPSWFHRMVFIFHLFVTSIAHKGKRGLLGFW